VLEVLVKQQIEAATPWDPTNRPSPQLIHEITEQAGKALRGSVMLSSAQNRSLLKRAESRLDEVLFHAHTAGAAGHFLPLAAEVVFGDRDAALPPLALTTPRGKSVQLTGKIDRVDIAADRGVAMVLDYKTRGHKLNLNEVYHGLALQLLTYLLLLEANGETLAGRPIEGVAAFYVTIMRRLEEVTSPAEAPSPQSPAFALRQKQKGLFDRNHAELIDQSLHNQPQSSVICFKLKNDGEPYATGCDHAEHEQFRAILAFVREKIAALADQIMQGHIKVFPYRIKNVTPCAHCAYRPVCRFDAGIDRYHHLTPMKRDAAIAAMTGGNS
jgi:ATP-dependent helicase/nuclease subunit B